MTNFVVYNNENIFLPKKITFEGQEGVIDITIDNKVVLITSNNITDITSKVKIAKRDN